MSKTDRDNKRLKLSRSAMNTILALSAIFISAASFYATYLQAKAAQEQVLAAEKQLKTETWPWLQLTYSNFDSENSESAITVKIANSGTGPALLHRVYYIYKGERFDNLVDLFDKCCNIRAYQAALDDLANQDMDINFWQKFGWYNVRSARNALLADGDEIEIFSMRKSRFNQGLWDNINAEAQANEVKALACYCSILELCYATDHLSNIKEVPSCSESTLHPILTSLITSSSTKG